MSEALAVKYRPKTFDEVCDQKITVQILKKVVENRSFRNVYLFAGDSGCGKTTLARIFANEINHGEGNPIEIDGGSAGNIDTIKSIIDQASQRSIDSEYKIFIIDECQNLGGGTNKAAWAALLKSLEEPAPYTIYMLCTTDPNKLPPAILNRVQRYNITKIKPETIKNRLEYICQKEGFTNYEKTCELISKTCDGGMRDAIALLELCAAYSSDLCLENTKNILHASAFETMFRLTWALQTKDEAKFFELLENIKTSGTSLKDFLDRYLAFVLDLAKFCIFKNIKVTNIPDYLATENNPVVQTTVKASTTAWFNDLVDTLLVLKNNVRAETTYNSTIEATLLKVCRGE